MSTPQDPDRMQERLDEVGEDIDDARAAAENHDPALRDEPEISPIVGRDDDDRAEAPAPPG
jgi:alkanesulfonate monooxygenase SsuD/methylene tetrahydromethanopterin reductase-like flavin-dependent oxidoreductase (luciferase family)